MSEQDICDLYGAVLEHSGDGQCVVEYHGLEADKFVSRALANLERSYGGVPIGRVDPNRPELPPHKVAWCRGYHGYDARNADINEITTMPAKIIRRIALRGERGILNLGARLPVGMIGLDVDGYGTKSGLATIAEHEERLGGRQPTYFVSARGFGSGSGIYLYRVPQGWAGAGVLKAEDGSPGDVETIQPHLRYIAAPGSAHHTGATYQLYHEASGPQALGFVLPALDDSDLAPFPDAWAEALYRRPYGGRGGGSRGPHAPADIEDVTAVAAEWIFDEYPSALAKTVDDVSNAIGEGQTRPAFHRALWIVARKARAGCYPFSRAVAQIEAAAVAAYAQRGLELDLDDFARSICHAVGEALHMSEGDLLAWGPWNGVGDADGSETETIGNK